MDHIEWDGYDVKYFILSILLGGDKILSFYSNSFNHNHLIFENDCKNILLHLQ